MKVKNGFKHFRIEQYTKIYRKNFNNKEINRNKRNITSQLINKIIYSFWTWRKYEFSYIFYF